MGGRPDEWIWTDGCSDIRPVVRIRLSVRLRDDGLQSRIPYQAWTDLGRKQRNEWWSVKCGEMGLITATAAAVVRRCHCPISDVVA